MLTLVEFFFHIFCVCSYVEIHLVKPNFMQGRRIRDSHVRAFWYVKFEPVLSPGQVLVEMSEKTEMSCIYQVFQALKCLFFKV